MSVQGGALPLPAKAAQAKPKPAPLPRIRDELVLFAGSPNEDGTPAWVIQDPVTNRFFRISWIDFELLVHWADHDAATLLRVVNEETPLNVGPQDLRNLLSFLSDNQLLRLDTRADVGRALGRSQQMQRGFWEWLLHSYLFFRLPLVRPQAWLAGLQPMLARVSLPWVAAMVGAVAVLGLYLASRQWDVFTHTLLDNLTWRGIVGYALALVLAKTIHELGHALVATHYGVRVAHMGVAFLVMFPMLYTDTGESWRLKNPRHRLAIASAGISVELALAAFATLLWSLAPDGAFRNGMFFLATTSWVLTLAINASPFMRFDGYFILSDLLDLPNLHERSSALAKVWLRRAVLGVQDSWPDNFAPSKRRWLIAFALLTWLYRLVVFLGIALLVYFFFFKLLGILLMILELYWFIGRPVWKEVQVWKSRKAEISARRKLGWWLAGGVVLALLLFPFSSRVTGYGWIHAAEHQPIHTPFAAQIVQMPTGRAFKAGDVLFVLESKVLGIDQDRARQLALARESQLAGLMGLPDGEAQRQKLISQKAYHEAEAKFSADEQARLILRAPFDGELQDVDHALATGVWVSSSEPMAVLVDPGRWVVDAYVPEEDLARIRVGHRVRARTLNGTPAWVEGSVESIDVSRTLAIPTPMLDAEKGGPLATVREAGRPGQPAAQVLRDALFRVRVQLDGPSPVDHVTSVRVQIDGERESVLSGVARSVASVLIRESGF